MNHANHCADRTTHLRIVAVALLASPSRLGSATTTDTTAVVKAGQPVMTASVVMPSR